MKIVFLDVKTIGEDIDFSAFDALGEVIKYSFSTPMFFTCGIKCFIYLISECTPPSLTSPIK